MPRLSIKKLYVCLLLLSFSISGCSPRPSAILPPDTPDLTVFTSQEKSIYEPIVKEYQERTGYKVHVEAGTFQDLKHYIEENTLADRYDAVFGIHSSDLEHYKDSWEAYESPDASALFSNTSPSHRLWTGFCSLQTVIVYNTKVVTYREVPTSWESLLDPSWKGRIAFFNPEASDIYSAALVCASQASQNPEEYLNAFSKNLNAPLYASLEEVNQAITDGQYSLGVTLDTLAEQVKSEGGEINYIYPKEGNYSQLYGSALILGCKHLGPAKEFIDFTVSKDVQSLLSNKLNRLPIRKGVHSGLAVTGTYQDSQTFVSLREAAMNNWRSLMKNTAEEGR
ncbi:MAG: extracellular solute-binding protein [Lacrimispora sp.]|uniref:extracellular solute-binding protein n=1 Tax=Lacrimispora sp. TaxID=2719234 RepID=UPI0039E37579